MEEVEQPEKKRRGWPKGKPRGPRKAAPVAVPMFTSASEPEAPIHVKLRLKDYAETVEFGCARRTVENGFHVFFYPSEIDRYRETRREFAITEIVEIEITEARQTAREYPRQAESVYIPPAPVSTGPIIHNARANALQALETSKGSIKMDTMPNLTFGNHDG